MKLTETLKRRIDSFFRNLTDEEMEYLTEKYFNKGVIQQRELLIAYNLDFYKGIKDVTLEDIEINVDKYLSNLYRQLPNNLN